MPSILLVEDDSDVRLIFVEILFDAGYEVDAVSSLKAGRDVLDGRDYDLVITDKTLRDGDGTNLAERATQRGIPALIVTGNTFDTNFNGARYAVLPKPMRPQMLLSAIEQILGRQRPGPD